MIRVHAIVSGRVQGVGFRVTAWQAANQYQLNGFVRNLEDGTVELELEGSEQQIENYLEKVKQGLNPFIKVKNIKVERLETLKGYTDFSMR